MTYSITIFFDMDFFCIDCVSEHTLKLLRNVDPIFDTFGQFVTHGSTGYLPPQDGQQLLLCAMSAPRGPACSLDVKLTKRD